MATHPPLLSTLPSAMQRQGRVLLNQQCWLWGQDIKRIEGNLLLQYGFERTRPPAGTSGSSQYTLAVADHHTVRLWGSGMYFGGDVGIYLNRYEFIPREAACTDQWQAQELTGLPRAKDLHLLPIALQWIAGYEQWVLDTFGLAYRKICLCGWKRYTVSPDQAAKAWLKLANEIETFLSHRQIAMKTDAETTYRVTTLEPVTI